MESSARCSSGVFVGLLCSSGHGVRSTASTVCDCWSPDGSEGSDDNRPAELCRQRADRLRNSLPAALRAPDRSLAEFKDHLKTYLFEH